MKLPNGFGSVHKLSNAKKRRNPWVAKKTTGWTINEETGKVKQLYDVIGYYPTREKALAALVAYNEHPYDLNTEKMTFSDVYEKWSDIHFTTLSNDSAVRTIRAAYKHCTALYNMRMRDIRVNHLEETIKNAPVGESSKQRIKSLFNMMFRYSMKHEIVEKDYAQLCDSIKRTRPKITRVPFSQDEIKILRENIVFPFVDMILVGIYTGFRPQELSVLQVANVDLENDTIMGGLKTDAGRDRIVPIHPLIRDLIVSNVEKAQEMNSTYLFNDENGQQGKHLTYDKYRGRFKKIMTKFHMEHKPHDTRHTFITKAKTYKMDDYVLKLIVGHHIEDITEAIYTHRTAAQLNEEMRKIEE